MSRLMLLDELMPVFDATRIEHRVVRGELGAAYEATRTADFVEAWRGSPAVRLLFTARTLGERAVSAARRRPPVPPAKLDSLRLADLPTRGEWILLGEDRPHEIAFGVVGRFWGGETVWQEIDASAFKSFDQPGLARIACNFSLRPYGVGQTLVSYECRTKATDAQASREFLRYWRPLSPFIGFVLRAQLGVIARTVEPASPSGRSPRRPAPP
jgi:hypothetical protein